MSELKPCKKHKKLPYLREIPVEPWQNNYNPIFINKRFEYICDACELEKELARKQPLIDAWNKEQEKK